MKVLSYLFVFLTLAISAGAGTINSYAVQLNPGFRGYEARSIVNESGQLQTVVVGTVAGIASSASWTDESSPQYVGFGPPRNGGGAAVGFNYAGLVALNLQNPGKSNTLGLSWIFDQTNVQELSKPFTPSGIAGWDVFSAGSFDAYYGAPWDDPGWYTLPGTAGLTGGVVSGTQGYFGTTLLGITSGQKGVPQSLFAWHRDWDGELYQTSRYECAGLCSAGEFDILGSGLVPIVDGSLLGLFDPIAGSFSPIVEVGPGATPRGAYGEMVWYRQEGILWAFSPGIDPMPWNDYCSLTGACAVLADTVTDAGKGNAIACSDGVLCSGWSITLSGSSWLAISGFSSQPTAPEVPEPGTWALALSALVVCALATKKAVR